MDFNEISNDNSISDKNIRGKEEEINEENDDLIKVKGKDNTKKNMSYHYQKHLKEEVNFENLEYV